MAKVKVRKRKRLHGLDDDLPLPGTVDNVEVKSPVTSVQNWATLASAVASGAAVIAGAVGLPIDKAGFLLIFSAIGLISSVVAWVRNMWFRNSVISSSVTPSELKARRLK